MNAGHWILDKDHELVPCGLLEWAFTFENRELRIVRQTRFLGMFVSTVFLGLDHGFRYDRNDLPPVVFETMIFGGSVDQEYQERCYTWQQAASMHWRAIRYAVLALLLPKRWLEPVEDFIEDQLYDLVA